MQLPQLKRIRWAVRAALILGVAASVCANVLHALPNPISQTISAWPPLALLLTVELTSRVPMHKPVLAALRVMATATIAGIAAWVSYWHMQSVAVHYGETVTSSYLLPISVDGLIVVASVSLVELAGRIRLVEEARLRSLAAPAQPAAVPVAPVRFVQPTPASALSRSAPSLSGEFDRAELDREELDNDDAFAGDAFTDDAISAAPVSPAVTPASGYVNGTLRPGVARPAVSAPPRTMVTSPTTQPTESTTPRQRRPVQETAELADAIEAMDPEISQTELARRLGISPTRLRAVRREAREVRRMSTVRR